MERYPCTESDSPFMAKNTLSFVCQNCGAAYNRWAGKCESCGEWNTLAEEDTSGATTMPVSIRSKRKGRLFALESLTGKSVEAPRLPSGKRGCSVRGAEKTRTVGRRSMPEISHPGAPVASGSLPTLLGASVDDRT